MTSLIRTGVNILGLVRPLVTPSRCFASRCFSSWGIRQKPSITSMASSIINKRIIENETFGVYSAFFQTTFRSYAVMSPVEEKGLRESKLAKKAGAEVNATNEGSHITRQDLNVMNEGHITRQDLNATNEGSHITRQDLNATNEGHITRQDLNVMNEGHITRQDLNATNEGSHITRQDLNATNEGSHITRQDINRGWVQRLVLRVKKAV